jgi:microsomal dipeptidase-like Zn-dependent dipeptidase
VSRSSVVALALSVPLLWASCGFDRVPPPPDDGIYGYANGCYAVEGFDGEEEPAFLVAGGDGFAFTECDSDAAARFTMRASDLGTYLFYDQQRRYLTAVQGEGGSWRLTRVAKLESELTLLEDGFRSPAEWELEPSVRDPMRYQLKHYQTGNYLTLGGLTGAAAEAAIITMFPKGDCTAYPELSLDAQGSVTPRVWQDGDLFGIAEIHSHMLANYGFGAGSTFHGAPFHRLGVEHALADCAQWHGEDGRRDTVGFFYDGDSSDLDVDALLPILITGQTSEFNHHTAGYPDFTDWPNSWAKATHQTMYYRSLERAYLAGLRLMVQHATGNSVLCELVTGIRSQTALYSCNDMVSVDRQLLEARKLERYIDAQAGGAGQGWLRIVETPEQARAVIAEGKLAMVLGIEISNLFDCFVTPREGFDACTAADVLAKLDHYQELGVSVIFPVHKFDNGFSAGDGSGGIIEIGNMINSGHYSNFVEDCPGPEAAFDGGDVSFGGLNQLRDDYDAPPVVDMSGFGKAPVATLQPFIEQIQEPAIEGDFCQNYGLTPLGETLIQELMKRGMLIDIAHLPQRSLGRAYELLEAAEYPVLKTHGSTNGGRVYQNGGMAGTSIGRCASPDLPGELGKRIIASVQEVEDAGGYPSEALAFDLNGFAHGPRPRFGPDSPCAETQANPVTYPFTSYDGKITFEQPRLGNREVDFNTEGMIHIGLLPELLEDARRDGMTDDQLQPLFRSAEAYIRLWEYAETRAASVTP